MSPLPGTEVSRSSASRQAGEPRIVASISPSRSVSAPWRAVSVASSVRRTRGLRAWRRRLLSIAIISTTWRRLATSSASARAGASATGLGSGRMRSANSAMTSASRAAVLARRPRARAKARIWRGLTTARGRPAPASAAATVTSKPPVASITTSAGPSVASRVTRASRGRRAAVAPRDDERLPRRAQVHVEAVLRDVAADEDRCRGTRGFHHDPGLRMRARPAAARTTVRVPGWGDGRGTALTLGLLRPSRARAPARHQPRRLFAGRQLRDTSRDGDRAAAPLGRGAQLATHHFLRVRRESATEAVPFGAREDRDDRWGGDGRGGDR